MKLLLRGCAGVNLRVIVCTTVIVLLFVLLFYQPHVCLSTNQQPRMNEMSISINNDSGRKTQLSWLKEMFISSKSDSGRKMVQAFLEACRDLNHQPFLVTPDMLKTLAGNSFDRSSFWDTTEEATPIAFATIDPSKDGLERFSKSFADKTNLILHVIYGQDPRGVLASSFLDNKDLPTIPLHYLWWSRDSNGGTLRLQLTIFWTRGDNLWHGPCISSVSGENANATTNTTTTVTDKGTQLPFKIPSGSFGQDGVIIEKFPTREDTTAGINVLLPANISAFLSSLQDGLIVECDHALAKFTVNHNERSQTQNPEYRDRVLKVIANAAKVLDRLGLTFWLSSGTALGWYRQCDVIPYTSDLDFEMRIQDYTPNITTALIQAGFRQLKQYGKISDSFQLRFGQDNIGTDVFFRYEEKDHYWYGMFNQQSFEKYRYIFPKYSLRWTEFGGVRVRVPYPPPLYMKTLYGKGWKTPQTSFHWLHGARNKVAAGKWPIADRGHMAISF